MNKFARIIYKCWRCFYVVLYFYFPPQIGLYFSYEVPFLAEGYWWQQSDANIDFDNFGNIFSKARMLHAATKEFLLGDETWKYWGYGAMQD